MTCIIVALVITAITIAFDVPHMLRNKLKKELWTTSSILVLGITLSIVHILHIPILNPFEGIEYIYKPISDLFFNWLK